MEKIKSFLDKYNILELISIFGLILLLFIVFYGKQNSYLVDVGREAYLPWQILEGKVLYKDIFNVYGPLGYQINAMAYKIFGISLNTLYLMGFLSSVLICYAIFFISKLFVEKKVALSISFLTIAVCVFTRTFFNFIFSYSYSALYALLSFLLSVFMILLYVKNKNNKCLYLSFLFAGFSFANKIENLPYFVLLFFILPFVLEDKKYIKSYLKCVGIFCIFPFLSFGVLILQGAKLGDFINAADWINMLIHSQTAEFFYRNYGLYYSPNYLFQSIRILGKVLYKVIPWCLLLYGLNFVDYKYFKSKFLKLFLNFVIFIITLVVVFKSFTLYFEHKNYIFCWLGICVIGMAIAFVLVYLFKFFKEKSFLSTIDVKDKMFFFLLISAILVSIKGLFSITVSCYGTYSLAVLFMPFVIFFSRYLPRLFKFINQNSLNKTIANFTFIIVLLAVSANLYAIGESPLYKVETDRGRVYVDELFKSQNSLINFIKENTSENDVIVSVPEGAIINFLANRKSSDMYYYLIPVNIEIFGEEKILSDFQNDMPDYFIINDIPYTPFNVGAFCDYAKNICKFIESNYTVINRTNDFVSFSLYKRNRQVK